MANLFEFDSYKAFIKHKIEENRGAIRGYQSKMADACQCQKAYFSRVLNSNTHLNSEQGHRLVEFWKLGDMEMEYFHSLIEYERAQSDSLRRYLKSRLKSIRDQANDLKSRYRAKTLDEDQSQKLYYSTWLMAAVHVITSIPDFSDPVKIANHFSVTLSEVLDCLEKLESMGLVKKTIHGWRAEKSPIHLSSTSPWNSLHHATWRSKAMLDAQKINRESLHYTVVQSHSKEDYQRIRELLVSSIDKKRKIVDQSEEQVLSCLCIDLFCL